MTLPRIVTICAILTTPLLAKKPIPEDLIDDPHVRAELGINQFTAPSIKKIFLQLDDFGPLPLSAKPRKLPKKIPLDRANLALEIGFLISEAFISVQAGKTENIEPIARQLQLYGRALGAGERVNRHAASLLDYAAEGKPEELKKELARTQKDVEKELVSLRDSDLAHLISLGGWARAFEVGSAALKKSFDAERAKKLFREDIADYYTESVGSLDPRISEKPNMLKVRKLLSSLRLVMTLEENRDPDKKMVKEVYTLSNDLMNLILKRN